MAEVAAASIDLEDLRRRYLDTQLTGDRRAALALIDAAIDAGSSIEDLQFEVIGAAQREIGRMWESDLISVAQEHAATAVSQMTLAHLFHRSPNVPRNGHHILLACVPGEMHDMPARLLADGLELGGYQVTFLGADVPESDLLRAIRTERPDLLALSVTMLFNIPALRSTVARVRESTGGQLPIAVGGNACGWDGTLSDGVKADITGADMRQFVAALNQFFAERARQREQMA